MTFSALRSIFIIGMIGLPFTLHANPTSDSGKTGVPAWTDTGTKVLLFEDGTWKEAEPKSLLGRLLKKSAGRDMAVLCDGKGIAVWMEGDVEVLSPAPQDWCLVDRSRDAIWVVNWREKGGGALSVIDLRAEKLVFQKVVTGIPESTLFISGPENHSPHGYGLGLAFSVDMKGRVELSNLDYDEHLLTSKKTLRKMTRKIRVKDSKYLKKMMARKASRTVAEPTMPECPQKIEVRDDCEDAGESCGKTKPIPNTPYCTVLTNFSCGDACYSGYELWNVKTRRFEYGYSPRTQAPTHSPEDLDLGNRFGNISVSSSGRFLITESGALLDWKKTILPGHRAAGFLTDSYGIETPF